MLVSNTTKISEKVSNISSIIWYYLINGNFVEEGLGLGWLAFLSRNVESVKGRLQTINVIDYRIIR